MTPQERQLIADLFDRLAKLEGSPRDAEAEKAISAGLAAAPNAVYPLVQTVLVQDEALKRANERIQALEAELGGDAAAPQSGGFLDSMRKAVLGEREAPRGSVPTVRPGMAQESKWGTAPQTDPRWSGSTMQPAPMQQPMQQPWQQPMGGGGSFLGTAASAAAGVIGGALLLDGIRSMFGHSGSAHAAFDPGLSGGGASPWGSAANSDDLARQAGLDDIRGGGGGGGGGMDSGADQAGFLDPGGADGSGDDTDIAADDSDEGDAGSGDFGGSDIA